MEVTRNLPEKRAKRMRPTPWLRAASILTLLHAFAHTVGGVYATPEPGPQQIAAEAMRSNTFVVMGHTRSMWAFYHGMGLAITISLIVEAIVFWVIGTLVRDSKADLRDLLVVFVIGYMALAVNSIRYFFYPPVIIELLIAGCLVMAILSCKNSRQSVSQ
jgi:Intracellular septation protein A